MRGMKRKGRTAVAGAGVAVKSQRAWPSMGSIVVEKESQGGQMKDEVTTMAA